MHDYSEDELAHAIEQMPERDKRVLQAIILLAQRESALPSTGFASAHDEGDNRLPHVGRERLDLLGDDTG